MSLFGAVSGYAVNRYWIKAEIEREMNEGYGDKHRNEKQFNRVFGLWFLRNLFFGKKQTNPASIYDAWERQYQQNKIILSFYVAIYLFFADDDKITEIEQKFIQKLFKQSRGVLERPQYETIQSFVDVKITKIDVHSYIQSKHMTDKIVYEAMKDIRQFLQKEPSYLPLINDLEAEIL